MVDGHLVLRPRHALSVAVIVTGDFLDKDSGNTVDLACLTADCMRNNGMACRFKFTKKNATGTAGARAAANVARGRASRVSETVGVYVKSGNTEDADLKKIMTNRFDGGNSQAN